MTKSNHKTPWVFRLGVSLLCALLLTTYWMGNLYARYSTTASGGDSARVAKFAGGTIEVLQEENTINQVFQFNAAIANGSYCIVEASFKVNFQQAEVARKYSIELTLVRTGAVDIATSEKDYGPTFVCPNSYYLVDGTTNTASKVPVIPDGAVYNINDDSMVITGNLGLHDAPSYTITVYYFVPVEGMMDIESAYMTCNLICEQVD